MLLFGSTMRDGDGDGDVHDANDVPLILCGGSSCAIKTDGRQIHYETTEDRRLCNLHLALAQRMGAFGEGGELIQQFGNSYYPLPGFRG